MTWGEFKRVVDSMVGDDDQIDFIDVNYPASVEVVVEVTSDGFRHFNVTEN